METNWGSLVVGLLFLVAGAWAIRRWDKPDRPSQIIGLGLGISLASTGLSHLLDVLDAMTVQAVATPVTELSPVQLVFLVSALLLFLAMILGLAIAVVGFIILAVRWSNRPF